MEHIEGISVHSADFKGQNILKYGKKKKQYLSVLKSYF